MKLAHLKKLLLKLAMNNEDFAQFTLSSSVILWNFVTFCNIDNNKNGRQGWQQSALDYHMKACCPVAVQPLGETSCRRSLLLKMISR